MQFLKGLFRNTQKQNSESDIELVRLIERAVNILPHDAEDYEIEALLVEDGITEKMAYQLVAFVPLAFTRVLLRDTGVRFSDEYSLINSVSRKAQGRFLSLEPVFVAALKFANDWIQNSRDKNIFLTIASRNAEFKAINEALHAGAKPENLIMYTSIIDRA